MREAHRFVPRGLAPRYCAVCHRSEGVHEGGVTANDLAHISGRPCSNAACPRCYVLHCPTPERLHPLYGRLIRNNHGAA